MIIHADIPHTLSGDLPHESWGGWINFLASNDIRGQIDGCTWYGKTNCNYFLFRDNTLHENFGYHADALWRRIQQEGADVVLDRIKKIHAAWKKVNEALQTANHEEAIRACDERDEATGKQHSQV
jgi:hypothetical protein